jgi:hypothetical protein
VLFDQSVWPQQVSQMFLFCRLVPAGFTGRSTTFLVNTHISVPEAIGQFEVNSLRIVVTVRSCGNAIRVYAGFGLPDPEKIRSRKTHG